jgi:DNA-binding NarL/FixJ family response regulator
MRDVSDREERAALYRELLEREHRLHELIGRLLDPEQESELRPATTAPQPPVSLTAREAEILRLLVTGRTAQLARTSTCGLAR